LTAGQKFITADEAQEAMLRYQDAVKQKIESCRRYPLPAQQMGIEGTVTVTFKIYVDGSAQNVRILKSSGSKILDAEAIKTVTRATPFSPLSKAITESPVSIRVAIVFSMR
jgi:protein TonB